MGHSNCKTINVRVGQIVCVKKRGQGKVLGVMTNDGAFVVAEGTVRPFSEVSEICLSFMDNKSGVCLIPVRESSGNRHSSVFGLGADGQAGVMGRARAEDDDHTARKYRWLPGWGTYRIRQLLNGEIRWTEVWR
jgi:hypothetical protein